MKFKQKETKMKTKLLLFVLILVSVGCSQNNFDEELRVWQIEYRRLDQSLAAPTRALTTEGAVETVHDMDKTLAGYQDSYAGVHAICAKYDQKIVPEDIAFETAHLRYLRARRDFYSYLAETDYGHGSNSSSSEFQRIRKKMDDASIDLQQAGQAALNFK